MASIPYTIRTCQNVFVFFSLYGMKIHVWAFYGRGYNAVCQMYCTYFVLTHSEAT